LITVQKLRKTFSLKYLFSFANVTSFLHEKKWYLIQVFASSKGQKQAIKKAPNGAL